MGQSFHAPPLPHRSTHTLAHLVCVPLSTHGHNEEMEMKKKFFFPWDYIESHVALDQRLIKAKAQGTVDKYAVLVLPTEIELDEEEVCSSS